MRAAAPGSALVERLVPEAVASVGDPTTSASAPKRGGLTIADEIGDPSRAPYRRHGKVYLTIPGDDDYVCSATAVRSRKRNVVITAGHCVFDAGITDRWARNWMFVPGKRDGNEPYGRWTAKRLASTAGWKRRASLRYDVGAAVMKRRNGKKLQNVIGARGIAFNRPRNRTYNAFGYPAQGLAFSPGNRLWHCVSGNVDNDSPPGRGPRTLGIECDMTGGSSGGGWVVSGKVQSVVSYGYELSFDRLYGPYFGRAVKRLYRSVRG
jgi:hypothetical protein